MHRLALLHIDHVKGVGGALFHVLGKLGGGTGDTPAKDEFPHVAAECGAVVAVAVLFVVDLPLRQRLGGSFDKGGGATRTQVAVGVVDITAPDAGFAPGVGEIAEDVAAARAFAGGLALGDDAAVNENEGERIDVAAHALLVTDAGGIAAGNHFGDAGNLVAVGGEVGSTNLHLEEERIFDAAIAVGQRHPADNRRHQQRVGEHRIGG